MKQGIHSLPASPEWTIISTFYKLLTNFVHSVFYFLAGQSFIKKNAKSQKEHTRIQINTDKWDILISSHCSSGRKA
jgi:hypothetical protein